VPRVVSIVDCGRVISPRTAASQVGGGVVWGIGAALREESEVDTRFGGFLTADIAEYLVPVNADIGAIEVEFIDEPDPFNSAGVKGVGEVSLVGVAAAIGTHRPQSAHHARARRARPVLGCDWPRGSAQAGLSAAAWHREMLTDFPRQVSSAGSSGSSPESRLKSSRTAAISFCRRGSWASMLAANRLSR